MLGSSTHLSIALTFSALLASTAIAPAETTATPASIKVAQAAPTPKPTPNPFVVNGYVRAYDFTRQNASNSAKTRYAPPPASYNYNGVNQQSFAAGVSVHAAYTLSGFTLGGTYLYSDPFTGCNLFTQQEKGAPCIEQVPPNTNPDDTLPGYQLSTLYEAYLQYQGNGLYAKVGNQVINTPWAPNSDSRLKPSAFQGADASYTWEHWTVQASDMTQFQSRTTSYFTRTTLVTSYPPTGNSGLGGNYGPPSNFYYPNGINTNGFLFGRIGYADKHFTGDIDYYDISDLSDILWIDGKYSWAGYVKPFVAVQIGDENNTGASYIGKIDSQVLGLQAGLNVMPAVQFVVGFDNIPYKSDTIVLPAGDSCNASTHLLKIKSGTSFPYWLPNNAPQCIAAGAGMTTVYYGGWASPYSDSYATDPFFTTELTQGAADRHIGGNSLKEAIIFTSANHQFVGQISHAQYNAGNTIGNEQSAENNVDAMYYWSHYTPGTRYRGLLLRYRYGERYFYETAIYGGLPLFKYNRAQIEYDF